MLGTLIKTVEGWKVMYAAKTPMGYSESETLPLYPDDATCCLNADTGTSVYFEIVDEFTHPHLYEGIGWGDGILYAKLVNQEVDNTQG